MYGGFVEPIDYNLGDNPKFDRTDEIRKIREYVVDKEDKAPIIESKKDYQIRRHPEQRTSNSSYDFMIKYIVEWANNSSDNAERYQHTECYPYIITWCGDGIVDTPTSQDTREAEECDPGPSGIKDL